LALISPGIKKDAIEEEENSYQNVRKNKAKKLIDDDDFPISPLARRRWIEEEE
jgi:hypothetical protein